jgi:hypothetical protein
VVPKLTAVVDGLRKIKDNPPVIYHVQEFTRNFEKQHVKFTEEYNESLQTDRRQLLERYHWQDSAIKSRWSGQRRDALLSLAASGR